MWRLDETTCITREIVVGRHLSTHTARQVDTGCISADENTQILWQSESLDIHILGSDMNMFTFVLKITYAHAMSAGERWQRHIRTPDKAIFGRGSFEPPEVAVFVFFHHKF